MAKNLGTQSDRTMNKDVKPVAPDCEGFQFAESGIEDFQTPGENYFDVHFDKDNNVIPDDYQPMHTRGKYGDSKAGTTMFADYENASNLGFQGVNFYGPEDVNGDKSSTVIVDVGRADRGKET